MFKSDRIFRSWNTRYADRTAFTNTRNGGYYQGEIFHQDKRISLQAHRVGWALYHGKWPLNEIDHINGIPSDNRLVNLREVNHVENLQNQKIPSDNKSGHIGVSWNRHRNKWISRISVDGKYLYLGLFSNKEDAVISRSKAETQYGFHQNHGKR